MQRLNRTRSVICLPLLVSLLFEVGCGPRSGPESPTTAEAAQPVSPSIAQSVVPSGSGSVGIPTNAAPVGMVWIAGGEFSMGGPGVATTVALRSGLGAGEPMCTGLRDGFTDSDPVHRVFVDGFWMDQTEETNDQFAR